MSWRPASVPPIHGDVDDGVHPQATELKTEEVEFDPEVLRGLMVKMNYPALHSAFTQLEAAGAVVWPVEAKRRPVQASCRRSYRKN